MRNVLLAAGIVVLGYWAYQQYQKNCKQPAAGGNSPASPGTNSSTTAATNYTNPPVATPLAMDGNTNTGVRTFDASSEIISPAATQIKLGTTQPIDIQTSMH